MATAREARRCAGSGGRGQAVQRDETVDDEEGGGGR